ncbi:unnamed protein product [Rhodiola kirilowii]
MALEYNFPDHMPSPDSEITENESVEQWGSPSDTATGSACNSIISNAFDCNICLEFVQDPVVTLCGHLYCWPCIYKWIHFSNIDSDKQPLCPVCKAKVSGASVVPLYSKGKDIKCSEREATYFGLSIPERPSAPICWDMWAVSARQLHVNNYEPPPAEAEPHQPQYYIPDATSSSSVPRLGGASAFQPIIEIFGEMVCPRMFGQSITNAYNHSNSYSMAGAYIPRVRRQLMHADQSLSRLCFFLVCCMIMCLLLF